MLRRPDLLLFNLLLGTVVATAYGLILQGEGLKDEALKSAFLTFGLAGLMVGLTVGVGATVGPRPSLPRSRCVCAQAMVVVTSAIGALIGKLLPAEYFAMDRAVEGFLADYDVTLGSGIGAAVGTFIEMVQIYRKRRRAGPKK